MTGFILAVIGVCALGVLLDVLAPEGEVCKYVKGVFGIFASIAIISPVVGAFGVETGKLWDDFNEYIPDKDYIDSVFERRIEEYESHIAGSIEDNLDIECLVNIDYVQSRGEINAITLIFDGSVILDEGERINILEKAEELLLEEENIKAEKVICVWR